MTPGARAARLRAGSQSCHFPDGPNRVSLSFGQIQKMIMLENDPIGTTDQYTSILEDGGKASLVTFTWIQ